MKENVSNPLTYAMVIMTVGIIPMKETAQIKKVTKFHLFSQVLQCLMIADFSAHMATNYGRPMKPFFIDIKNFWAWADKLGS